MSEYFRFPMPSVQSLGIVTVPVGDQPDMQRSLQKPIAAAVLTMTQRNDGHVMIFDEMMSADEEPQFPLPWLIDQALIAGATTLVGTGDAQALLVDAAQQRFFVEPKLAALSTGDHTVDVPTLVGNEIDEATLSCRLGIPWISLHPSELERIWTERSRDTHAASLGKHALAMSVSRLMLWANLMATHTAEPGWFYETMLALRCWLDGRETDAPELYAWGTSKPIMRAVSSVEDYRRDLGRRLAGRDSDWPTFEAGLFHS